MAMAQRALGGLLRHSLGLAPLTSQRALSACAVLVVSAPAVAAVAEGEAAKAKRAKKKNLFDVVEFLPDWGIGYKVSKITWRDVSYQITKINLYKDNVPCLEDEVDINHKWFLLLLVLAYFHIGFLLALAFCLNHIHLSPPTRQ